MNMGIDESGHDRPIAQINNSRRGWTTDCLRDVGNHTILDQNFCRPGERIAYPVEKSRTYKHGLRHEGPRHLADRLCSHLTTGVSPGLKSPSNRDVFYADSQAIVATTSASTPVRKVGWMTGAKCGLWLLGSSLSVPASLAFAYTSGSVPPTNQNTDGTCHSAPKHPKSSLAGAGPISRTRSAGKCRRNSSATRLVAAESFSTRA